MGSSRPIKYTEREQAILALVPFTPGEINSNEIVEQLYPVPDNEKPLNARVLVVGRLTGIAKKAERNAEPWRLRKSPRAGCRPIRFWRERI